jgi:hypothetical protein
VVYAVIFTISLIYALILYYLSRKCQPALADRVPCVILVWLAYIAVGLSYLVPEAWLQVVGFLVVSLGPVIIVHLVASYQRGQRLVEYFRLRGEYDRAETMARARGQSANGSDRQDASDRGESAED